MISDYAYARAPRAHLLTGRLNGVSLNCLHTLYEMLCLGQCDTDTVLQEEADTQLTQIVDDLMNDIPGQSRTGKLCMEYIRHVRVLLLFIRAERMGNWDLQLYAVSHLR